MRFRLTLALLALLALAVAAAPADARKPRHAKRLTEFTSCNQLVDYAGRHAPVAPTAPPVPSPIQVGGGEDTPVAQPEPPMVPNAGAPDAGDGTGDREDTSGTNNQEAGVHEPDTFKTDGSTLFVLTGSFLHAVDARGD